MNLFKKLFVFLSSIILIFTLTFEQSSSQQVRVVTPANGNSCVDLSSDFVWEVLGGTGTRYHLQVGTSATFTTDIVNETSLSSMTYTVDLPDYDTEYFWKVSATFTNDGTHETGVASIKTKPAPPALTSPADEATCVPIPTILDWEDFTDAEEYFLQVSESATFTTLAFDVDGITSSSYTVDLPDYDQTYYWRVRVLGPNECTTDWSEAFQLTTSKRPPTPTTPMNNAIGVPLSVDLEWGGATDADSYRLQVSEDPDFSTTVIDQSGLTGMSYAAVFTEYDTKYYWRMNASYPGCVTVWSEVKNFRTLYEAPVLTTPEDEEDCVELQSSYSWEAVTGAEMYTLQISDTDDFSNIVFNATQLDSPFGIGVITAPITQHWWRVRAEDNDNVGMWSTSRSFTSSLDDPQLLFPDNGLAGLPLEFSLAWQEDVPGSIYRLQVATSTDFNNDNVVNESGLTEPTYDIVLPENYTDYFWRVKAAYSNCSSSWSEPFNFRTVIGPPELRMPEDEAENQPLNTVFVWGKSKGAETYEINVASDTAFNNVVLGRQGIPAATFMFTQKLPVDTDFWWRVRATNDEGTSLWSETFMFTTGGKGAEVPQPKLPEYDATMIPVNAELVWYSSARAKSYKVQVSKSREFIVLEFNQDEIRDTMVTVEGLENFEEYYWRVSSVNDSGMSAWSDPAWVFRTIALAPTDPVLLWTPLKDIDNSPVDIIFSWDPVDRAYGYHIQAGEDSGFPLASLKLNDSLVWNTKKNVYDWDYSTKYYWRVRAWNEAGQAPWSETWSFTTKADVSIFDGRETPFESTVYPNPVSGESVLEFTLPEENIVEIKLYNLLGESIGTLANRYMNKGTNRVNLNSDQYDSGTYIYTIRSGSNLEVRQIVIVK